jgi:hypothetical protein
MQQTIGFKRFVINHVAVTALAIGVVVSGAIGVAGLAVTEGLPWTSGDEARIAAPAPAGYTYQAARFYDAKFARLEAEELQRSALAADAAKQETMRRYVEHKEQQLDALP